MLKRHKQLYMFVSKEFCGYVCSNGNADYMRDYIFDKLATYKEITSSGKYRKNIGKLDGVEDKLEFQKQYKFALALFEKIFFISYLKDVELIRMDDI